MAQYVEFFNSVCSRLKKSPEFDIKVPEPAGANWQVLAFLPWAARAQSAGIFATFTREKKLRVELYIDCGDVGKNKERFDELSKDSEQIEATVGEALVWERRNDHKACRVALYKNADVAMDFENEALIAWAASAAIGLKRAFASKFPPL